MIDEKFKCKICGHESSISGLSNHVFKTHKMNKQEYYDKHLKKENEDICKICNKNKTKFLNISLGYKDVCSDSKCIWQKSLDTRKQNGTEFVKAPKKVYPYNEQFLCKIDGCNYQGKNYNSLSQHIRYSHLEITNKEYYDKFILKEGEDVCICGNKKKFNRLSEGYYETCCEEPCRTNQILKTCDKLYGGIGMSSPTISKQIKATNLENLGVENPFDAPDFDIKNHATRKRKYGDENFNNRPKCRETKKKNWDDENYSNREKFIKTMNEEYGGPGFKSPIIVEKYENTNLLRYGNKLAVKNEEIRKKISDDNRSYEGRKKRYEAWHNNTYEEYLESLPEFEKYKKEVWRITNQQSIQLLENHDKRGHISEEGTYQLDHIISIKFGFDNKIVPEIIGDIFNLQFLPSKENTSKGAFVTETDVEKILGRDFKVLEDYRYLKIEE